MKEQRNVAPQQAKTNVSRDKAKSGNKKAANTAKLLSDDQKLSIEDYKKQFQVRASTKKVNKNNTHVIELHNKKDGISITLNFLAAAENPYSHTVREAVSQERYYNGWADIQLSSIGNVTLTCNRLSLRRNEDGSCAIFAPRYEVKGSKYECFFFNPEFRIYLNDLLSKIFHDASAKAIDFDTSEKPKHGDE